MFLEPVHVRSTRTAQVDPTVRTTSTRGPAVVEGTVVEGTVVEGTVVDPVTDR